MTLNSTVLTTCADNISAEITNAWGLTTKVHSIVTDSGSKVKAAVWLCKWNHLACFAHTLNLIVSAAIKNDHELDEVVQKVKVVTFSTKALKHPRILNLPSHRLVQHVDTRWIQCITCLIHTSSKKKQLRQHCVYLIAISSSFHPRRLPWSRKPFLCCHLLKLLQLRSALTEFKIIPITKGLRRVTLLHTNSTLADNLRKEMTERFPLGMEENYLLAISTLLDPRFKEVAFSDRNAVEKAKRELLQEAVTQYQVVRPCNGAGGQ